jgi:hypothetical protein
MLPGTPFMISPTEGYAMAPRGRYEWDGTTWTWTYYPNTAPKRMGANNLFIMSTLRVVFNIIFLHLFLCYWMHAVSDFVGWQQPGACGLHTCLHNWIFYWTFGLVDI